jgi:hypothetical protein
LGIAGVEPCQLALTLGTTGSGSTDSPAPSPIFIDLPALTEADNDLELLERVKEDKKKRL